MFKTMIIEIYVTHRIVFGFVTIAAAYALYDTGKTSKSCPPRFYGNDCEKYCRYPFFGNQCKDKCECRERLCHHLNGCPPIGTECPLGFRGKYCDKPCKFPYYGVACQQKCLCPKTKCKFSTGCFNINNIYLGRNSNKRNITTATQRTDGVNSDFKAVNSVTKTKYTGIKETKTEENDHLNEDIGISRDRQSYFRTTKDDIVNIWTGKARPKQHLLVNKNLVTQNAVLSIGVVLIVLVMLHVLLSINNYIKRKGKITYV